MIGEIGLDMAVFGTPARLCSWAKVSPRTVQSGRTKAKAVTGKGNPYLKAALGQMATGVAKTDTFLGQRYRRLAKRMPKAKALAALQRSILVIIFHLLADPAATFEDLGADYYDKRVDKQRHTANLVRQLEALGHRSPSPPQPDQPPHGPPKPLRGLRPERGSAPHPAWRAKSSRLFTVVIFRTATMSPGGTPTGMKMVPGCPRRRHVLGS